MRGSLGSPLVAEFVAARALLGITLDVERDVVRTRVDVDIELLRLLAAIAPHPRLILARRDAAEVELVRAFDRHVRGRIDHEDERRHARVDVAADANEAGLVELDLARLAVLEQPEIELR